MHACSHRDYAALGNLNSRAFAATITVDSDIRAAPNAGERTMP
jgi:hypothetical protein